MKKDQLIELKTVKARHQGRTTYISLPPQSSNTEYQRATYKSGIITLTPIKTSKEVSND